jgi:anti-sigma factor RsiW
MTDCPFNIQLEAFHDGELDPVHRAAMVEHLKTCGECSRQLAKLQALSGLFSAAPRPELSQIAWHRLHHRVDEAMERGLLRLGWGISAVAASVLLVGSIGLNRVKSVPQAPPPWMSVAMSPDPVVRSVDTPVAEWYLADASNGRSNVSGMDMP